MSHVARRVVHCHMSSGEAVGRLRLCVILNVEGGAFQGGRVDADPARIADAFAANGARAEIIAARGQRVEAEARAALARFERGEIDGVVVGGGDGTVSTVAGVLAGTDVPLGILPLGTLNHFAKDLGLAPDLETAIKAIVTGERRRVDVAELNGRVFVNNSSVGVYPYMVLERERQQGRGYRKFFATIVAFLRIFRRFPRRRLLLCAEGDVRPYRTPCLFVGNNPYAVELTRLGTRERVDGGELCVYVARHAGLLGVMRLAWHAALGNLDQARDFDRRVLRTAEIRSRASRIIVARDGEVERMRPPLRYRIRPGALVVFAPAERA